MERGRPFSLLSIFKVLRKTNKRLIKARSIFGSER